MSSISLSINAPTWAWYIVIGLMVVSLIMRAWLIVLTRKHNKIALMRAWRGL